MLDLMPRKIRVQYPGAMYHPPSPGSGGRVGADGRRVGAAPGGRIALGKRSSQGRPACGRGTTGPGWISDELVRRPKNDPEKLASAARLRRETILSLKRIARRVGLGSSKSANAKLHNWMQAHGKTDAATAENRKEKIMPGKRTELRPGPFTGVRIPASLQSEERWIKIEAPTNLRALCL
jgi:hypothetical protein